jgi:ribose-phosphate pyrophosphokinase
VTPLVLAMPGNERLAEALARELPAQRAPVIARRYPDGESCVRIEADTAGREVLLACTLDRPDDKLVPLLLLANAAREGGASRVGLVAPYLPYMRQDRRFHAGEATSARHVARWISREFDWLVTVDPHLHRIRALDEIYPIPSRVVHAAGVVAAWIGANVAGPLLVGPDEESSQWVADVAARLGAPHVVLAKIRRGDRDVAVSMPDVAQWSGHTPVLVDDIVSTARTMMETVRGIRACGLPAPVCIAVHAIFAGNALAELQGAGAARVVSTDTVAHATNAMSMAGGVAAAVREL